MEKHSPQTLQQMAGLIQYHESSKGKTLQLAEKLVVISTTAHQ